MSIKRVFLGTSASLPELAAQRLLSGCGKLPDFSKVIFSVPGNYARTAFQNKLASIVPDGVFEPQIMTPGVLLHCGAEKANTPGQLENELIWNKTALKAAQSGDFDLIFPSYHAGASVSGAPFSHLRLELAAGGFSITDAKTHLGTRGEQLAELEKLYLEELDSLGFTDRLSADIAAAENIDFFAGVEKVILCGLVDLPRMLKKRIENIDQAFPGKIEAWIFADEDKSDLFDHTGCAIPEKWNSCAIEITNFEKTVHCVETFEDAAQKLTELFEQQKELFFDETAIVLADPAMFPVFKRKLAHWAEKVGGKLDLYDPSGIPFSELRLHKLLSLLLVFCKNRDDMDCAVQLIKNSDFLSYLAGCIEKRQNDILLELDKFLLEVLPAEISNTAAYLEYNSEKYPLTAKVFALLNKLSEDYKKQTLAVFLREFFTKVYRKRRNSELSMYKQVAFSDECALLQDSLETLENINSDSEFSKDELFELFCKQTGQERLSQVPTENALAIQGCLELPYLHEKNIFFCGVSASTYPDRIIPTTYLTDTIRRKIGIRSNQETFARAASHLHSLCKTTANISFITTKRDKSGEPLSPSPLFFSGDLPQEELLKRSRHMFKDTPQTLSDPEKWKSEYSYFTLTPQLDYRTHKDFPDIPVLSVTAFSAYIRNPLDCFLNREMNMKKIDYLSKEPDAITFGNIVHATFQKLGTAVFRSEEEYCKNLKMLLNEVILANYGKNPSALIEVVRDNISQRFEYAAPILLKSYTEEHFIPLENEFVLGGEEKMLACHITGKDTPDVFIKGTVDRIEYSPERNLIRIIDFKTGSKKNIQKIMSPYTDHETAIKLTDLQMPLYADLLRQDKNFAEKHPDIDMKTVKIECAYFTLPKNVTDTDLLVWEYSELEEIIPYAWQKVLDIINEMKKWKNMEVSETALKNSSFADIFMPDMQACLNAIHWIEPIPEKYQCK